ncbi:MULTISPECIES: HAMP domain-containing sensor histidine kinase [unclassified Bdellovibrio]|uniref:sensor histidine kinase n=1 Tax=unclassified Bdellovibrio TaxID=2633795 RepID=UPI0011576183|nr:MULTISPECIES: HAMP domain-containing sensor histidine kinase [unclassified Bdellovibrio]QDK46884.1 sensor histidine kinase [Bdellovibrio sp. ZAP7]QLY25087.1 HAMP domain-containing histidine kinase [Bdellovibrio sp. KM01]
MKNFLKSHLKTVLAIIWFAFTFALVAWWWVFFLMELEGARQHRMIAWEGSILLGSILIGGISLIVFTFRDKQRHDRLRFFFSTFSHDIKTSIARLRLQAEVLEEDLQGNSPPVMKRLIADIQRLDLQLENSLLLANLEVSPLLHEEMSLSQLMANLRSEFADLSVELERDAKISGDRRALMSVVRNLLQNSVLHGKATTVRIRVRALNSNRLEVIFEDDGLGFKGETNKLGSELLNSKDSRGNGIGLLITKRLMEKMRGDIKFESSENAGFKSILHTEGHL